MPPIGSKSKGKVKDHRQSRSRNTTPSSLLSAPESAPSAGTTLYLELPTAALTIPGHLQYDELLDRLGGTGGIPDPKNLDALASDLRTLSDLAGARENACDGAMRSLVQRRKQKLEAAAEMEVIREVDEKPSVKRSADDDEGERSVKAGKLKRKKDPPRPREERPSTLPAQGAPSQSGAESTPKGKTYWFDTKYTCCLPMMICC